MRAAPTVVEPAGPKGLTGCCLPAVRPGHAVHREAGRPPNGSSFVSTDLSSGPAKARLAAVVRHRADRAPSTGLRSGCKAAMPRPGGRRRGVAAGGVPPRAGRTGERGGRGRNHPRTGVPAPATAPGTPAHPSGRAEDDMAAGAREDGRRGTSVAPVNGWCMPCPVTAADGTSPL